MSSPVEDEIVSMKFENTQFQKAASDTMSTLDKLKSSLQFPASAMGKGLSDISSNIKGFNLNPMVDASSEVGRAFSAMSVTAISAIATIASEATQSGLGIVKSLSVTPITDGFGEYNTTLNSIQTILSNTGLEGQKGLDTVNSSLNQLNHYADQTIYNFTQMAKNVGTFTAAGVKLDTSVNAIKGIANLAAVSGSSADQASTAMYQLSQALATGTVRLMDWNSVSNAGLGGKVFKDAILETARAHGIAIDAMIEKDGSFRDSLQEGWFSADILTETLSKFTGDLTDQQLKSMGYTAQQIKDIQKLGVMASDAAEKVKTLPQLFGTLKEAVGSGWTKTFQLIFGDFGQAKKTFTALSNYFGGIVGTSAKARNRILKDWGKLKGREVLIKAFRHAWESLMSVLGPIHDAFREIFPKTTGEELFKITQAINHFFKALVLSKGAQKDLKNTFAGLFAVLHIGFTIISGILHLLGTLIGLFFKSQGSTLAFTGGIGLMLVALDKFLTRGHVVEKFFDGITKVLVGILTPLLAVRSGLFEAFAGLVTLNPTKMFSGIHDAFVSLLGLVDNFSSAIAVAVNTVSDAFGGLGHIHGLDLASMFGGSSSADQAKKGIDKVGDSLSGVASVGQYVRTVLIKIKNDIANVAGAGASKVVSAWNTVLGIFHSIANFLKPLTDQFGTVFDAIQNAFDNTGKGLNFDGVLSAINTGLFLAIFVQVERFSNALTGIAKAGENVLKQVTSNLKTMQNEVRANILLQIAVSLTLLAGAIFLLSKTDPKHLAASLGAISIMLIELVAALKILEKTTSKFGDGAKLVLVSVAMGGMAIALAAMAGAVYLFSKISAADLAKGLAGVSAALLVLTISAKSMTKSGAGANMIGAALGLLIMSAALVALVKAIDIYSKIDAGKLANGLLKIGATLLVLNIAMKGMQTSVGGAVAMVIVSAGLIVLAKAMKEIAKMKGDDIKKSLVTIAAALGILALGMYAMQEGLPGAAALLVMVAALTLLTPVIIALGALPWDTVKHGLEVLLAAMGALALIGLAMTPVVATLVALAAAIALIGAGVFLAGTGVAAFATGLALLAHNGAAGFTVLKGIIMDFLHSLPQMILAFGDTFDAIAKVVGDHAPGLITAFTELLGDLIDAGIKLIPRFTKLFEALIKAGLKVLVSYYSDLGEAGLQLIEHLLKSIADHVGDIAEQAGRIAIEFVKALAKQGVKFANAALQALIDFLNGLATAIRSHSHELNEAGGNVALAIIQGIGDGIRMAFGTVKDAILSMLRSAASAAKNAAKGILSDATGGLLRPSANVLTGPFTGLVGGLDDVNNALDKIKGSIKDTLDKSGQDITDYTAKLKKLKQSNASADQIKKVKDLLAAATLSHKEAKAELKAYQNQLKANGDTLKDLGKDYDDIQVKITDAGTALTDAQNKQSDFKKSINDTFGTVPDIQAGQSLKSYLKQLDDQKAKIEKFKATLAALRAAGLDDESYNKFLSEGVDAQKVMDQLLAGGPDAVKQFEDATAGLHAASQGLADMASSQLGYDNAVTVAQAFLDGLINGLADPKSLKNLDNAMTKIALIMMNAIKAALHSKSPSRKAMEIAYFFVKGLTNQMDDMHGDVAKSSAALGITALDTLQTTLSRVGNGVNTSLNMSPVITPVLDLTQLTKDANNISSLLAVNPIAASMSFAQASDISAGRKSNEDAGGWNTGGNGEIYVEFNQENNSPKALDDITIYRNTNSGVSLLKRMLKEALNQ